jgi:hypothetical protein
MVNSPLQFDKGVLMSVPEGYSYDQTMILANALYLQFFSEHESFCYQLDRKKNTLKIFAVN